MKTRIIFTLIAFFALGQILFAQTKAIDIECNLKISGTEWVKGSTVKATLTVKNNSDKKVKIYLPPGFKLVKQGKKIHDPSSVWGDQYSAKEKDKDHIILKQTKNSTSYKLVQYFEFALKSGESKAVDFDISKLAWNASMSSILIDRDWFNLIPSGNYDLYYYWNYDLGKNEKLRRINIVSNKIEVKLNGEK